MSYNGYPNRPTWNVVLWLNNTESLYRGYIDHIKRNGKFNATRAKKYVTALRPSGKTPDGDSLASVKWSHVASSLNE